MGGFKWNIDRERGRGVEKRTKSNEIFRGLDGFFPQKDFSTKENSGNKKMYSEISETPKDDWLNSKEGEEEKLPFHFSFKVGIRRKEKLVFSTQAHLPYSFSEDE